MPSAEIKKYQAVVHAGDRTNRSRGHILLFDAKANTIGTLVFVDDGTALPANVTAGIPMGYYPVSLYAGILDLLRNEAPVFVEHDASNGVRVVTLAETVGEGEPKPSRVFPVLSGG